MAGRRGMREVMLAEDNRRRDGAHGGVGLIGGGQGGESGTNPCLAKRPGYSGRIAPVIEGNHDHRTWLLQIHTVLTSYPYSSTLLKTYYTQRSRKNEKISRLLPSFFLGPQLQVVKLASLDEMNHNGDDPSLDGLRNGLPQTAVSKLPFEKIIKIFRVKKDHQPVFDVQDHELIPIPKRLDNDLSNVRVNSLRIPQTERLLGSDSIPS